jgi:hypothetical protein
MPTSAATRDWVIEARRNYGIRCEGAIQLNECRHGGHPQFTEYPSGALMLRREGLPTCLEGTHVAPELAL